MIARMRRWLEGITHGDPVLPLAVLFAVYFFDEFDTAAFNVLAPQIKRAFHLTDQAFFGVVAANLLVILVLAIPLGHYGDRLPRQKLVVAGAVMAGVFSFLTGAAPGVGLLLLFRIGNGVGVLVNDPIHSSLLSDYYRAEARPRVFALHRNAVRWGALVGAATAGLMATLFGWRVAFMVLLVPILLVAVVATRLPHVARGASDDPEAATVAEQEPPAPFARAIRILWTVRTLRWQYASWVPIGAGLLPLAAYFPLYLDREFHLSSFGIGLVIAGGSAVALVAIQLSGHWTQRWLAEGPGEPLKWAGLSLALVGPCLVVVALAPNLPVALAALFVVYFTTGIFTPPFVTVQAMVSPARARSLSFSLGAIFLALGLLVFVVLLGNIGEDHVRRGIFALAPFWVLGGLILHGARRFVGPDTKRALDILATSAALRQERLATTRRSLLVCRNVDVSYGQTQVLFGVDFDVQEGEIVALLGTNGAGKSTLLKAIAGTLPPDGGAIFYSGSEITGLLAPQVAAAGVALVPGGKGVFPGLTVAENFSLAAWLLRKDEASVAKATEEALAFFPVLRDRWHNKAGDLSGGEQQMLVIGMALLARPRLLMIDELSLGLAPLVVERLLEVVRRINETGVTVVLVEQSVNVALTLADRAVFMEKGEVRFDGPTAELLDRPDVLRSVFLEGAAAASAADGAVTRVVERTPFEVPRDRKGRPRPPVLAVSELAVSFGGIRAVDGVDFGVHEGQILGLIGPNGAGKTTIFDLVSGFLSPDSGRVVLRGTDVTRLTPDARGRMGLGRSFQDARLFPSMTVWETIAVARERHLRVKDPLAAALVSPATRTVEREVAVAVDRLVELMRLDAFANKFVSELSTGSRRVVDLACTLAHEPAVLLLDEPSSGIAQRETEALGPLLLDIRDETGAGMVVIEHDMPLITSISDDLMALELGRVLVRGRPEDVVEDPAVVAAYLGTTEAVIHRSGSGAAPRRRRRRPVVGV